MTTIVLPLLIYWLVVFVISYVIVEYGQSYFYDEVTPHAGLKVTLGSLGLAALLTWTRSSFETMFTNDLPWTVLQALAWVGVFIIVYQFHPVHALAVSLLTMVLVSGMASMAISSLTSRAPTPAEQYNGPPRRIRQSLAPAPITSPEKAKGAPPPAAK